MTRLMWLLAVLCMTGWVGFGLTDLFTKYVGDEVVTKVTITEAEELTVGFIFNY